MRGLFIRWENDAFHSGLVVVGVMDDRNGSI